MTSEAVSTAHSTSPDSGQYWTAEGAWPVGEGIYRIPLPLPTDALKAVNVYVLETDDGLTLIDGGWAIEAARDVLGRCLRQLGYRFQDLRRFLVTHVHRDHYTLAAVLGSQYDADVSLGLGERATLEVITDPRRVGSPTANALRAAGAFEVANQWPMSSADLIDRNMWRFPDTWLDGDFTTSVGSHTLDAVHTPGHTPGHYVFAERAAGLLFAGDHVLPTITPSIGFAMAPPPNPLGDFLASLAKVRKLPDLTILPAHGPVAPSSHRRVDELLSFHEMRLAQSLAALAGEAATAFAVAQQLTWTRHNKTYAELELHSKGLAALETKAHLELLVVRGQANREESPDGVVFSAMTAS
ncbi:MAG: MBL fold metallo-hydrolase [Chloroflexi bacterium]|nr:MBL fold metallo-hydrolase [Chloroflexota bacterium]